MGFNHSVLVGVTVNRNVKKPEAVVLVSTECTKTYATMKKLNINVNKVFKSGISAL